MKAEQLHQVEEIYRQSYSAVTVHAYRFLGNWEEANEAAQEVFRIVCAKPKGLLTSENQIGWLKTTARYVCFAILRERTARWKHEQSLDEIEEYRLPAVIDELLPNELTEVRGVASEEDLRLLYQIFVEERSYQDVADALGISVWACYKRVQRIIKAAKQKKANNSATIVQKQEG
ncbi:MAG: sigma-70 family RNA polymerase sigma factor [Oscillospiraceae bacterium]|jgi:DNA-directed RNA polymerase specialized sigma24 family protein|nr:sigma-70 family RNA polymerase sigma factor [Oscillospiraceae bacterium]